MPRSLALLGVVAITSGWWYVRNVSLYGDPFRAKAEAAMNMFNGSAAPHSVAYWGDALGMLVGSGLGLYPTFPVWPPTIFLTFSVLFGFVLAAAVFTAARRRWTPAKAALGAYGIFAAAVVLAYQVDHFQPHGRLLYPAILVFAWALVGLRHSIPPEKRPLVALASILGLAGLSVALVTSSF